MFVTLLEPDDVAASYQRPRRTRATPVLKRADSDTVILTTLAPRGHAGANSRAPERERGPQGRRGQARRYPDTRTSLDIQTASVFQPLLAPARCDCVCVAVDSRRHAACLTARRRSSPADEWTSGWLLFCGITPNKTALPRSEDYFEYIIMYAE
jgi:hypothetical protein